MLDAGFPTAALAFSQRASAAIVPKSGNAPAHFRNARRSSINRLQSIHYILPAVLVTRPRPVPRAIQIDADPSFVIGLFQNAVAGGEVDIAVAQVIDAFEELRRR